MTIAWEIDDDRDGVVVHISTAARAAYEAEWREDLAARSRAEIRIGAIAGAVLVVAALVIKHLLGA